MSFASGMSQKFDTRAGNTFTVLLNSFLHRTVAIHILEEVTKIYSCFLATYWVFSRAVQVDLRQAESERRINVEDENPFTDSSSLSTSPYETSSMLFLRSQKFPPFMPRSSFPDWSGNHPSGLYWTFICVLCADTELSPCRSVSFATLYLYLAGCLMRPYLQSFA